MSETSNPLNYPTTTIETLLNELQGRPLQATVDFGGLEFIRFKQRSPTHFQAVFRQTLSLDDQGHVAVDNH